MTEAVSATSLLSSGIIHTRAFYREGLQSHALCAGHTLVLDELGVMKGLRLGPGSSRQRHRIQVKLPHAEHPLYGRHWVFFFFQPSLSPVCKCCFCPHLTDELTGVQRG